MKIKNCNWRDIERYLEQDDRVILPLGSTEQHAWLSLCTDGILAEEVSIAAAEPLGIPVYPAIPFGLSPYFMGFPGTVSLRVATYCTVIEEILDSIATHGFKRIMLVNGHGGNQPAAALAQEWACKKSTSTNKIQVKFHNWWNAPATWAKVQAADTTASHASWMENFPSTRLEHVIDPTGKKEMIDLALLRLLNPQEVRKLIGDGNYGGEYRKDDSIMQGIWDTAVQETRTLLEQGWA